MKQKAVVPNDRRNGFSHPSNFRILEKANVARKVLKRYPSNGIKRIHRMRQREIYDITLSMPQSDANPSILAFLR